MIIRQINYPEFRQFEEQINGNVKVGGYGMDKICPISEGQCYTLHFKETDISRLYLLKEETFTNLTFDKNYLLSDLNHSEAIKLDRVKYWLDRSLDLRFSAEWSPIFVSRNTENSPIVAIDGNHRLMAHFIQHKRIEGVNGYLFVHPNIDEWHFMPSSL